MDNLNIKEFHFPHLESTNDWGKKNLLSYERSAITLIIADEQSAGRGQYGRQWLAPCGNLYASFCFFMQESHYSVFALTQVMAISIIQSLQSTGLPFRIKRPNDILVRGKKIAGILCETIPAFPDLGIVLGIGLNVNMSDEWLDQIQKPATSLLVETGKVWQMTSIMENLKNCFCQNLAHFFKNDFSPFLNSWNALVLHD